MTAQIAKDEIAMLMPSRLSHYFTDEQQTPSEINETPFFARIGAVFGRLGAWIAERRAHEEAVNELARLSDRELADIGLVRSDLLRVDEPAFVAAYNAERETTGTRAPARG